MVSGRVVALANLPLQSAREPSWFFGWMVQSQYPVLPNAPARSRHSILLIQFHELAYCPRFVLQCVVFLSNSEREGRLARRPEFSSAIYSLPHVTPHSLTALRERVPRASVRAKTSFVSVHK